VPDEPKALTNAGLRVEVRSQLGMRSGLELAGRAPASAAIRSRAAAAPPRLPVT
jgi:hypothetical protein